MWNFEIGFFLAAHGLIHLGYITPAPSDPRYPFSLSKSWLVTSIGLDAVLVRPVGIMLSVLTVAGFALTALAATGIIIPQAWWQPFTVMSAVASLLLLLLFWHTWLIVGVVIDVVLLVALFWLRWLPLGATGA